MASTTKRKFTAEILRCILLILALSMLQEVSAQNDPCESDKYLGSLQQRKVGYIKRDDENFISDFYLQKAWYKLPPNYTLSNTSVPCGTLFNWWLNDTLPTSGYGLLTVCQNTYIDTCARTKQINVTSCSQGHVYELTATDGDLEAYCIEGSGKVVPDAAPDISGLKPVISAHISKYVNPPFPFPLSSLEFYCNLSIETKASTYKELFYDIEWNRHSGESKLNSLLFVGNVEYTNETDFLERTKLTEEDLKKKRITKPGFTISCSVRARASTFGNNSHVIDSEPMFNGIKILTPMPITVQQDMSHTIQFQLTMPFGCIEDGCSLTLHMVQADATSGNCLLSDLVQTLPVGGRRCGFSFQGVDDVTSFNVSAKFGSNQRSATTRVYELLFSTPLSILEHPFFEDYLLPPIRVQLITDQKILQSKQCYSVGDPNLRTFDGMWFSQHIQATYILYRHKTLPVEVQTKATNCNDPRISNAHCNCGVTVRAGRDIFQINNCDEQIIPPRIVLCDDGVLYQKIHRQFYKYEINLPHGTKVEIYLSWNNFIDVIIYPSLVDFKQSEGLCGYFDGNYSNDYTRRDGSVKEFNDESWRVLESEDLFIRDNYAALTPWSEDLLFCDCSHNDSKLHTDTTCSTSKKCTHDSGTNVRQDICEFKQRKKRDVSSPNIDLYTDHTTVFKPALEHNPSIAGSKTNVEKRSIQKRQTPYTNETALADCLNMINTTLFQMCTNLPGLDINSFIENCVSDAVISNSMDWTMQYLESIEQTCLNYVEVMQPLPQELLDLLVVFPDINSTEYYNESYEYQPVPALNESSNFNMITTELYQEMLEIKCPNDCNGNGQCIHGICHCNEPYISFNCLMKKQDAPTMKGIPDRGECDLQNRPCEETSVFGLNIAEVDSLTCRLTYFTIDRNNDIHFGESRDTPGQYESIYEIYCPLTMSRRRRSVDNNVQLDDVIAYGYETSFSNDGEAFSESDTIVIYDSICVNCTKNGVDTICEMKGGFCLNGGRCYAPGDLLGCYSCSDNGDEWIPGPECPTEDDDTQDDDGGFINWMISIIILGIAVVLAIVVTLLCKFGKSSINRKKRIGMSLTSINAVTDFEHPHHGEYGITPPNGTTNERQHFRRGTVEFKPPLLYDLPLMNDTSAEK